MGLWGNIIKHQTREYVICLLILIRSRGITFVNINMTHTYGKKKRKDLEICNLGMITIELFVESAWNYERLFMPE